MEQTGLEIRAMTTTYTFACPAITLAVEFMTPLLLEDLKIASRPASYIKVTAAAADGKAHEVETELTVDDSICLNFR